jgi:hypothetical protein
MANNDSSDGDDFSEELERDLDALQDREVLMAYDRFWMSPTTSVEALQSWLDKLELCQMRFEVRRFRTSASSVYCETWEGIRQYVALTWTPQEALAMERDGHFGPQISLHFDTSDPAVSSITSQEEYVTGVFPISELEIMTTDQQETAAPSVLAIVERRSALMMPVTTSSVLEWSADDDGAFNELKASYGPSLKAIAKKYGAYFDSDRPLDEARADADIQRYEHELSQMILKGEITR